MLAEASRVIDLRVGGPARWVLENDVPEHIVLLTPTPRDNWSTTEAQAGQADVLVLTADEAGSRR
jgi:hypothetical protein